MRALGYLLGVLIVLVLGKKIMQIYQEDKKAEGNMSENTLGNSQKSNEEKQNLKSNQAAGNISKVINIWSRLAKIAEILLLASLPISSISVLIILMSCSSDTCCFWIPIAIMSVFCLFFAWLFSLSAQAVLEVLMALNNNIAKSVKSVKDNVNSKA